MVFDYWDKQRITLQKNDEDGNGLSQVIFKFTVKNIKQLYSYQYNGWGDSVKEDVDEDANKFSQEVKTDSNGKIVFRAILRLTKGSFVAADERKTIEFVDVTVKSEPHENKAEELVLFLERYYQSGLSEQEIRKAVNLTAMLVKEKAEKLGARLVLSSSYKNVLENKNYV